MTETEKNKIAERVTALIPKAGSLAQFAKDVGVSTRSVHYWVNSERIPSAEAFINMHLVYGEPLDYLMGVSDDRKKSIEQKKGFFSRLFG